MSIRVTVYKRADGDWAWRAQARNGRIIATSGEGYINKQDCIDAMEESVDQSKISEVIVKGE